MLSSTSPTISSSPSPATTFHRQQRPYHAPRRTSHSSCASPRPQVSSAPSRRPDAQHSPAPSPLPYFAPSPQLRRRKYADIGTQYSPDGFPPTYKPAAPSSTSTTTTTTTTTTTASVPGPPSPQLPQSNERGQTPADASVTEPPEPSLRFTPQPAASAQHVQPIGTVSAEKAGESQRAAQTTPRQNEATAVPEARGSPAKRARPQSESVTVMPLKYETCEVKDLGILISDMLMELVRLNDDMPLRDGQLTRFHSRAPPAISVKDYLFRLIVHATLSPPILLSMVFYVDKLCTMCPAFTISSLTVHRFLITAATVAAKGLSDSFWTNSLYAKVGGVSLRELALLELEFLQKLDWRIVPKPETLVDYYKGLVERGEGYVMEKLASPHMLPTISSSPATQQADV